MSLTTKGRYAVTALLDLTINESRFCYVSLSEVARRQDIPEPYLKQLFRVLRKAEILEATTGPKGGFRLARSSSDISIKEIVQVVETNMDTTQCRGNTNCSSGKECLAHELWSQLNGEINEFLSSKSLLDVAQESPLLKETNHIKQNTVIASI